MIYAHDGRGLGHVSRSIGIGLALRRLYPQLKVLFVSGCRFTKELIGSAPLDWIKLPAYETEVVGGKSIGIHGNSMFSDAELGELRGRELAHVVSLYRPRLVLVDHTPQGKHKELVLSLTATAGQDTLWILGVRGVVGAVEQARSKFAGTLFKEHYHALLWYGDSAVLGRSHREQLQQQYNSAAVECGYVLRLAEFVFWNKKQFEQDRSWAGTISIPWLGEKTMCFLTIMAEVLKKIPQSFGRWRLFVDMESSPDMGRRVVQLFGNIPGCLLESPGGNYVSTLLNSKIAVIYGGYNSLMDVVFARIPALVVLREMQDEEQHIHLQKLIEHTGGTLTGVSESQITAEELERLLLAQLQASSLPIISVNTNGAVRAAEYLKGLLS